MKDPAILMEPIPFITEEAKRQTAVFHTWSGEDWEKPTFCEGWTRKHVVAHSKFGVEFYENVVSAGVRGNTHPPFGAADREEFLQKRETDRERMFALPPDLFVDEFEMKHHSFVRVVKAMAEEDLHMPGWHPMGKIPVGHFAGMRLFELALHDWDIRAAGHPDAALRTHLLTPLLRALPLMQVRFLNLRPAADAPDGVFRFVPNEAAPWTLTVQRGLAGLPEKSGAEAEVTGEGEAFIFHTTGRMIWREMEERGRLSIGGDRPKAEKLLDALSVSY